MEALDHDQIKLGVEYNNMKDVSNSHIIKGKRTKRQRHQSPLPFPITTTTTATQSSGSHQLIPSPATSSEFLAGGSPTTTSTTDEDEDTAMCLILLSKGFSSQEKPPRVENEEFSVYKFNSKRYLQPPTTTASTASGKAAEGIYVYECKTCSRTFPSFQALGGHRASHKKPKTTIDLEEKKKPLLALSSHFSDEEEPPAPPAAPPPPPPPQESSIKRNPSSSSSLYLQLTTRPLFGNPNNKSPKLHECGICGAEFNSGQALGGHMRRHRLPTGTTTTNTTLSLVQSRPIETESEDQKRSRNDGFCLDLNLPAPEDHDHHQHDSKFAFAPKQEQEQLQQPSLVLSTRPTLVDCHY